MPLFGWSRSTGWALARWVCLVPVKLYEPLNMLDDQNNTVIAVRATKEVKSHGTVTDIPLFLSLSLSFPVLLLCSAGGCDPLALPRKADCKDPSIKRLLLPPKKLKASLGGTVEILADV